MKRILIPSSWLPTMANLRVILVLMAILAAAAVQTKGKEEATVGPTPVKTFGRSSFPAGFVFGAASAAYQVLASVFCNWVLCGVS